MHFAPSFGPAGSAGSITGDHRLPWSSNRDAAGPGPHHTIPYPHHTNRYKSPCLPLRNPRGAKPGEQPGAAEA
jgi:hypothetical protein